MLVTIRNLPSSTRYTDLKALLLSQCGLVDGYVLDNLVADGTCKIVTIGLAEEEDAALLARKINGYNYKGNSLYVQDVRKNKKTTEQTYQKASSDMGESSKAVSYSIPSNTASQNTPMNQWMMSTPFYNMPTQSPYYTLPQQTSSVGYGSQQQQTMFQASQYQYPSQGSVSQAPLGFRPEGNFSNMPWSQNQQTKNQKNYFMQDDSNSRPEKRSLDDRSGDNYSELAKKSRWDDSYKTGQSTHEEMSRSDDRGWQVSGRGDDRGRSNNAYDYDHRNNDRKGDDRSNDTNSFFYQSVEKGYYSDRSNEHNRGYDQPDDNREDFPTSDENRGNFDRHFSTGNNYGQSSERDGNFDCDNGNERSLNKAERFYYDEESTQAFNKFHWPPLNTGTSNDSPSRSSELYGGQNQNNSRDKGQNQNQIRIWENSNHAFNNRLNSDSQSRSRKYGTDAPKPNPKALPMPTKPLMPGQEMSQEGSSWRRQAISSLADQVLRNVGCEAQEGTLLMKRLKESIARKVDIVTYNQEMPCREIVKRYRAIHVAANDHFFFKIILTQVQKEEAPTTVHIDVTDRIYELEQRNHKERCALKKQRNALQVERRERLKAFSLPKAARKRPAKRTKRSKAWRVADGNAPGLSSNKPPTESTSTQQSELPSTQSTKPTSTQQSELPSIQSTKPTSTQPSEPLSAQLRQPTTKPSNYTPPSMFILPNHPKGDKLLFHQIKRNMNLETSGGGECDLHPFMRKAIDEELYPLGHLMQTAKISNSKKYNNIFKEIKESKVTHEFIKALGKQISMRQWYRGPVSLRIFARPRMPNKTKLSQYLDQFGVISLKAPKKPGIMLAFCKNYQCYDNLLNTKDAVCDGSTLIFKPMKLVASNKKVQIGDINRFRRYYITSQIDESNINILRNNDGKPYVLMGKGAKQGHNVNKDKTKTKKNKKAAQESHDTADDAVTINEGAVQSSAMKEEDIKDDGNISQLTEETTINAKADCETKDDKEPTLKVGSNTNETSVLINKTHEEPAENKNQAKKILNDNNSANPGTTEHKNKPDHATNNEANVVILEDDENDDGASGVDLDLNEVDDDELEDY